MSKKGWVRKSTETTEDEYPTGGGPCQKRGGLGMSTVTGIQPGKHEYQLSLPQW